MANMYDISIPPLILALNNLLHILKKGRRSADARNIEHSVLLNARLAPDMYPLIRQVQIATDMSKGAGARLAGIDVPKHDDNEATFDELEQRLNKTISFLNSIEAEQLEGAETRHIELMVRDSKREFVGLDYLLRWVQPNVYFHVTTTYSILRHNGVELGKRDFLGPK
ncbi:MAG: hypothetical protein COB34_01085 [Methylophilaceae bacterium]|nr:MAG: hypothetical protein COB34_01085 [Methylophilaceae bacterium]